MAGYVFSIPNGGKRTPAAANWLKEEGLLPGVLDTFLSLPSAHYSGFYIEFKKPGEMLRDEQSAFAMRMMNAGFLCHVYTDGLEAYEAVKRYVKNEKLDTLQWLDYSTVYTRNAHARQ